MDRRKFLKSGSLMGPGLVIGFHLPVKSVLAQFGPPGPVTNPPDAFVRIAPDNTITIISKHTEMGQGIYTGLATMVADEMDAEWSSIKVVSAPVNTDLYLHTMLGLQGTGGSMSVPNSWIQYRTVGATARAMLVTAAARRWDVPESEISVSRSVVSHSSGRTASFGELSDEASALEVPENVSLKTPDQFTLIGKSAPRVDSRDKSDGSATFTIDIQRPGMLVAVVAHSPRFGGKVSSWDATETMKIPGVVDVVEIPRGVAVLAVNTFAAMRGRDVLDTQWDYTLAEHRGDKEIMSDFVALLDKPGAVVQAEGDANTAISEASQSFEALYTFPYLAHAPMEPLDCTIEQTGDTCVIRSGTQMPSVERDRVAEVLGLDPANVQVENLYAGGGFGRRGNFVNDIAHEAATIVKATGGRYPVKLQYTREDDTTAGFYRPMFVHKLKAGLDNEGNITGWKNTLAGQSFIEGSMFGFMVNNGVDPLAVEGAAELPYHVPNMDVSYHMAEAGVPTLAWRSVGHTHTAFSKETFLDELLHASGKDPIEARLALMHDERSKAVLELAAEKAGWGKDMPDDRGIGVAFVESFSSRVAEIAEVSQGDDGRIRIEKVVCAVDCGTAINPGVIEAQIQSAIMFGLSAALYGEISIENGVVQTSNFHNYPVMRISDAPEIEVHIMQSTEPPTGIGEPGLPPAAPAVANAWFNLTGKRIRQLPFEPV